MRSTIFGGSIALVLLAVIRCSAPASDVSSELAELRREVRELKDEAAIRALAHKFSDAANRRDGEMFQSLWAPGAEWIIGPPINVAFTGKGNMGPSVTRMLDLWDFFVQLPAAGVVEVRGDSAYARFYVNEVARARDKHGNYNLSMYDDLLVRIDGEWYFRRREYKTIYQDAPDYRGTVMGPPVIAPTARTLPVGH